MYKLEITPEIESVANEYLKNTKKEGFLDKINWLKDEIEKDNATIYECKGGEKISGKEKQEFINYIDKISTNYDKILLCKPGTKEWNDFENDFSNILDTTKLSYFINIKPYTPKEKAKMIKFYEALTNKLGYDTIQSKIFPSIIEKLNIKTCVYCNIQYAIVADKNSMFQLDHCWPKSKYPYLSTSFYNLQPCCGACNQRKSDADIRYGSKKEYNLSIWKLKSDPCSNDRFFFHLEENGLIEYKLFSSKHDRTLLKLKYTSREKATDEENDFLKEIEEKFHISSQYNNLLDVVEETVWKHQIYSPAYQDTLVAQFNKLFPDVNNQVKRLITGTYEDEKNIYKRPLTKMIHDIWEELDCMDLMGE